MKSVFRVSALVAGVSMAVASQVNAEQALAKPAEELVVVTATRFEQKIADAPASISVVSQADVLSRPNANLLDVLKYQEGVDIGTTRDKTGQGSVSMRGLTGEYTLLLIDGKRQNNHGDIYPNNFGGNAFGHIPPAQAIERVEVIRGPASTLYGADAMGGVVNIITKKNAERWFGVANFSGTFQGNDQFGDNQKVEAVVSGPLIRNKLMFSLRGSAYESDASSPEFENAVDPNGDVHVRSLGFGSGGRTVDMESKALGTTFTWLLSKDQTLRLDYDTSSQVYDNTPVVDPDSGTISYPLGTKDNIEALWQDRSGIVNPRAGYAQNQEFTRDWWSVTHEGTWGEGSSYVSLAYVVTANEGRTLPLSVEERLLLQEMYDGVGDYAALTEDERKALAEETFLPRPDRTLQSSQYTLDAHYTLPLKAAGKHILVVGGQVIDGELEDGVFGMESSEPGGVQSQKMYSLFIEDSWTIVDPFTLTAGVRYDEHDVFGSQVSPRLYGVWSLAEGWTVKGGVATGYKTPKTTDLYDGITGFGGQGTSPFAGNPDLKPETSINSEIAVYWDGKNGYDFNITYFNTKFEDKIASGDTVQSCSLTGGVRPCVNLGVYDALGYTTYSQKINIDKVDIQGIELAGRYALGASWGLSANYTWTDSEQKSGANAGQPLTNTAEHMANASLNWQALSQLSFSLQAEYRSDRFRDWDNTLDRALYYKSYEVLNLGVNYTVTDNFKILGRINNLLDEDFTSYVTDYADLNSDGVFVESDDEVIYTDNYNVKDAGRSFWLSAQLSF